LTEELVRTYGRKIKNLVLQPSGGGVFEVTYNGTLIFSKKSLDRFPEKDEVPGLIDKIRA
jgi:selenoprotein W-related protein